jgi:hypothetical protein
VELAGRERQGKRGGTVGLKQGFSLPILKAEIEKLKSDYKTHPLCSSRPKKPLVAIDWWKRKLKLAHRATQQLNSSQYLNIRLEDLLL